MPVPVITTLQFDVTTDVATPHVTLVKYGDGSIEFANADGIVRRLHSDHEYLVELFDLIDGILNP